MLDLESGLQTNLNVYLISCLALTIACRQSPNIMDPKTLLDYYKSVNINSTTFFANSVSVRRFDEARNWASLGKPVDREEWGMTVPTV
jgi:hypothetical protein